MTYGSLFAGAGGTDLGLDAAGWKCAWQVEIEPAAVKVLEHHWPDVPKFSDVCDINGADLEPVDVVAGGFPCQDLSVAGHRAGFAGSRSSLLFQFQRIVKEMRDATGQSFPRWVVWENVAGLLSIPAGLAAVYAGWDDVGAVVQEHRLIDSGRAFGIPQRRRRVFGVVGFTPGADTGGPVLADPAGVRRDTETGRQAGQDIAGRTNDGSGIRRHTSTLRASSMNVDDNTAQDGHLIPTHTGTITANWHKGAGNTQVEEGICIPSHLTQTPISGTESPALGTSAALTELGVRRLTPTECERLMGWPDGHTAPAGADSHRYRLCGNGVIAPAAEWVARRLEASWA